MNKQDLINTISQQHGFTRAESERILDTILATIKLQLTNNHLVRIRNFGTFQVRESHGRPRAKFTASKNFFILSR